MDANVYKNIDFLYPLKEHAYIQNIADVSVLLSAGLFLQDERKLLGPWDELSPHVSYKRHNLSIY